MAERYPQLDNRLLVVFPLQRRAVTVIEREITNSQRRPAVLRDQSLNFIGTKERLTGAMKLRIEFLSNLRLQRSAFALVIVIRCPQFAVQKEWVMVAGQGVRQSVELYEWRNAVNLADCGPVPKLMINDLQSAVIRCVQALILHGMVRPQWRQLLNIQLPCVGKGVAFSLWCTDHDPTSRGLLGRSQRLVPIVNLERRELVLTDCGSPSAASHVAGRSCAVDSVVSSCIEEV